jgi:hypothetical protein
MAKRKLTEAERLRQHNEEMKLALASNITVLAARRQLAMRRWREFQEEIERRQRCGTQADRSEGQPQSHYMAPRPAPARQPYWWERD